MTPPWGINWQRYHADRQDMPHIAKMGYKSFTTYKGMWDNRDFVNELLSVARKDAIFLNRDHAKSEEKDDQWKNDPALKGRNHADDWAQKVKAGQVYTPLDRTFFLGLNEPDSHQFQRQIDAYNEAYCRRMAEHGLRAAAYSFGVGQPSTVGLQPKTPPDWSWYAASAAAVLEGHHLVATHEYGAPDGYGWEYWCNRISFCPYPFDVVFDECGIDYGVVDSGNLKGWSAFMDGPAYCRWLDGFQVGMAERAHTRKVNVLAYNIFGFDHGSSDKKDWHSFDIRPIRPLLEAFQWTIAPPPQPPALPPTPQPAPPVDVLLPFVPGSGTAKTMYVMASAGIIVRDAPGTRHNRVEALPFGAEVSVKSTEIIYADGAEKWARIGDNRWVAAWLLSDKPPQSTPEPVQPAPVATGIIDPLTALAFMQVESNGRAFDGGLLVIRFEVHRFKANLGNDDLFNRHFKFTPGNYADQYWRPTPDGEWLHAHGQMADRHKLLAFARNINNTAALRSTGMGMAQIMGENHARIGYATPQTMFNAFKHLQYGYNAQLFGFANYMLSDPDLFAALRQRDWMTAVQKYNGTGQEAMYIQRLEATLEHIENEVNA